MARLQATFPAHAVHTGATWAQRVPVIKYTRTPP